jgi:hypothetical protein
MQFPFVAGDSTYGYQGALTGLGSVCAKACGSRNTCQCLWKLPIVKILRKSQGVCLDKKWLISYRVARCLYSYVTVSTLTVSHLYITINWHAMWTWRLWPKRHDLKYVIETAVVEERETLRCSYTSENELVSGKVTACFKMFRKECYLTSQLRIVWVGLTLDMGRIFPLTKNLGSTNYSLGSRSLFFRYQTGQSSKVRIQYRDG